MAVAQDAQLFDEFRERMRLDAKVRVVAVDDGPDRGVEPVGIDFFGTLAEAGFGFVAWQGGQRPAVEGEFVVIRDVPSPAASAEVALRVTDGQHFLESGGGEGVGGERPAGQPFVIEGQQPLEHIEVGFGVARGGQKAAQHDGAHKDQGLSAFPVGTETRQGLRRDCLAFRLRLEGNLLRREDGFNQRRGILERQRGEGVRQGSVPPC